MQRGPAKTCKEPDLVTSWKENILLTWGDIGLLTGPHHTSFSEPSSLTIRLSRGERPVLAPEYAVKAPVEVMAEPVSYTKASSYNAATDGFAIYEVLTPDICTCGEGLYNGDTVVVNMSILMKLFLNFSVLALWPDEANELEGRPICLLTAQKKICRLTRHHQDEDWSC